MTEEQFYNLMQEYRHTPITDQGIASQRFYNIWNMFTVANTKIKELEYLLSARPHLVEIKKERDDSIERLKLAEDLANALSLFSHPHAHRPPAETCDICVAQIALAKWLEGEK